MSTVLKLVNGIPRTVDVSYPDSIYDEVYAVPSPITAGVNISLPNSGTYDSTELKVELNGVLQESVIDYNYVGTVPRTQIQMTFELVTGDRLRFKKGD